MSSLTTKATAKCRVVTYNLLSSRLCSSQFYSKSDKKVCKSDYRWDLISESLAKEADKEAIICVQEISLKWTARCAKLFQTKGYHFVTANYGKPFNGYMGVGIAFPMNKYTMDHCELTRVADQKPKGYGDLDRKPKEEPWYKSFMNLFAGTPEPKLSPEDEKAWRESKRRFNQMIMLKLHDNQDNVEFCVGTYHMPCAYWAPKVMTIHAALAGQVLETFAESDPYILCGDFNFKPDSAQYNMMLSGSIPEQDPECPSSCFDGDTWKPELKYKLSSAYAEANGREPEFTNYAFTTGMEEPFVETLDYIFYPATGGTRKKKFEVQCTGVKPLPSKEATMKECESFPSATEPSDHLMIAADLEVTVVKQVTVDDASATTVDGGQGTVEADQANAETDQTNAETDQTNAETDQTSQADADQAQPPTK